MANEGFARARVRTGAHRGDTVDIDQAPMLLVILRPSVVIGSSIAHLSPT